MSSEERQREIREHGSRPGETQRQEQARSNGELLARADAETLSHSPRSSDDLRPTSHPL